MSTLAQASKSPKWHWMAAGWVMARHRQGLSKRALLGIFLLLDVLLLFLAATLPTLAGVSAVGVAAVLIWRRVHTARASAAGEARAGGRNPMEEREQGRAKQRG